MFKPSKEEYAVFIIILLFIIFWSNLLYFISPTELVELIGVRNGYIVAFFIAVFGGASTFTVVSIYPAVAVLAIGGLNPFILGLISAAGLTISNILYFYFGFKARVIISRRLKRKIKVFLKWLSKKPGWIIQIMIFVYVGLTPLPNNILTTAGGLTKYPFKKILVPLILGNITLMTLIAYLAVQGIQFFV